MIVLPGSKNTRADLDWLRANGWDDALRKHLRYGGKLIGICGGFQMLGKAIVDEQGAEGKPDTSEALGLLDMRTTLTSEKRLAEVKGCCTFADASVRGYEIHLGLSQGAALDHPAFIVDGRPEGAHSADGQILGTYLHGLFDHPEACKALLEWAGLRSDVLIDVGACRERSLDRFADAAGPLLDAVIAIGQTQAMPSTGGGCDESAQNSGVTPRTIGRNH